MRIGLCQIDSQWEDRSATKKRILRMLSAWGGTVDLLIFPEMVLSGFTMGLAAGLDPSDHAFFEDIAKQHGAFVLYGGVKEKFNCVFCASRNGETSTLYRKRHLFTFGGETDSYQSGTEPGFLEIGGVRLGLSICYDLRFGYQFWPHASDCDGFVVIASWPETRKEHWLTLLKARAIENLAFVIGVNRVGTDPKLPYSGDSSVFGPFGERLLECGRVEGVYCTQIDFEETARTRNRYQFLKDRTE